MIRIAKRVHSTPFDYSIAKFLSSVFHIKKRLVLLMLMMNLRFMNDTNYVAVLFSCTPQRLEKNRSSV